MSIKLDDIDLSAVKGELSLGLRSHTSSVTRIGIIDKRRIVKHDSLSTYGTIISDQGKTSARVFLEGRFVGDDAANGISSLRSKYKKGEPLNLISDITSLSNIHKVMIEDIRIQMSSTIQLSYNYQMILAEYVETMKKPSQLPPSQKAQALQEVGSQAADALGKLNQDASAAIQKAQALQETASQAATAFENLGNDNLTPSQKAEALQEVGSKAAQVKKEIDEDYF